MIPKRLSLSGFTSYRKTVELDFTKFNLACISGPNGAGKSSILDAITYALYGKARKSDDALINSASDKAESMLDFEYEGQTYRVNRSITRGKGSSLDFYILNPPRPQMTASAGKHSPNAQFAKRTLKSSALCAWITKPSSTRRFFLQGKADSFATQRPADRKRILSSILGGLNQWDEYLEASRARSRQVRLELDIIDAKLAEIQNELDQEEAHKTRLKELEDKLKLASAESKVLQAQLDTERARHKTLDEKRQYVMLLKQNFERAQSKHEITQQRHHERQNQLATYTEILNKAPETEAAYQTWQNYVMNCKPLIRFTSSSSRWMANARTYSSKSSLNVNPCNKPCSICLTNAKVSKKPLYKVLPSKSNALN